MNLMANTSIGQIASELEAAILYFERAKIDYTCDGGLTLKDACDRAGIPLEEAMTALQGLEKEKGSVSRPAPHWDQRSMAEIIDHILVHHHRFNRKMIGELTGLLEKLPPVYGFEHPQLIFLKNLFKEMGDEMRAHMSKEEEAIFPYLLQRERAEAEHRDIPNPFLHDPLFRQPIRILEWEHQMTGKEWEQVRLLTNDYTLPHGTGSTYRALYEGLRALEQDLHRHVHLENNVLFKRALEKGWLE